MVMSTYLRIDRLSIIRPNFTKAKMLGHKSLKIILDYAKIFDLKGSNDLRILKRYLAIGARRSSAFVEVGS